MGRKNMKHLAITVAAAALAAGLGAAPAAAFDFDDPESVPLHFALETLSGDAVTRVGRSGARETYFNLEAPPDAAALTTTNKFTLSDTATWYVRVDLDGMVFSAAPALATSGGGEGSGFASAPSDVLAGGAGEPYVVFRLPRGMGFARDLTFGLSIEDSLAAPAEEGSHRVAMALYDELGPAVERDEEEALSYSVFGGEAVVVVMTSGIGIGIHTGFAVADVERNFLAFTPESASGNATGPDDPSAPAVLGRIEVGVRQVGMAGRPPVYAARGGQPVTAEAVIETVSATVAGDMTFGELDLRTGTRDDHCRRDRSPDAFPAGGVLPLAPPFGEETVTDTGVAVLAHGDGAWGVRHLCVWLPDPGAGETPVRIPIVFYEATVSVQPPFGDTVVRSGEIGLIGRSGTRVDIAHLTTSALYDQELVIVNSGVTSVRYEFAEFRPARGVAVTLTPAAAAARDSGRNIVPPRSQVVLPVADTLSITGPESGEPAVSAALSFNAKEGDMHVAVVQTNRGDGSTDTVVYKVRAAVEPEDRL